LIILRFMVSVRIRVGFRFVVQIRIRVFLELVFMTFSLSIFGCLRVAHKKVFSNNFLLFRDPWPKLKWTQPRKIDRFYKKWRKLAAKGTIFFLFYNVPFGE